MGPRPDGRGTNLIGGMCPVGGVGFNGAATGWPRNARFGLRQPHCTPWLQWGRDRMAAERTRRKGISATCSGFNGAATGWPRNAPKRQAPARRQSCFNGAATGWPRNALGSSGAWGGSMWLQWGRDRMAAERVGFSPAAVIRSLLQWGRDRMAAERLRPPLSFFFNQWLQWGRDRMAAERTALAELMADYAELQWGRDRMAAERCRRAPMMIVDVRFNGAATGWPRNVERGCPLCRIVAASMGPRPDGRGTCAHCGAPMPEITGFNGAATGWPRNARPQIQRRNSLGGFNGAATGWPRNGGSGAPPTTAPPSLQWGRDRMAAERLSRSTIRPPLQANAHDCQSHGRPCKHPRSGFLPSFPPYYCTKGLHVPL